MYCRLPCSRLLNFSWLFLYTLFRRGVAAIVTALWNWQTNGAAYQGIVSYSFPRLTNDYIRHLDWRATALTYKLLSFGWLMIMIYQDAVAACYSAELTIVCMPLSLNCHVTPVSFYWPWPCCYDLTYLWSTWLRVWRQCLRVPCRRGSKMSGQRR